MSLKIGNKVAVLDDVLKGNVIGINGAEISVETTDGMIFKFNASELVRIDVKKSLFKKEKKEVILEVDLHISKLTKSTRNMDNYDMLNLQLDTAKSKIEFAIAKRIAKVVFIHGVGEGVLRSELLRLLNKYPVKFYDASYKKYGLGATEVYIFQNPI